MTVETQVAIVGGGPVGAGLAIELGLRGIRCVLVERRHAIQRIPKGQNLTQRTLEHFWRWGIADQLRAARPMPRGSAIGEITAYGSLMSEWWQAPAGRETVRDFYYQDNERLPQYRTEAVLRARLAELPGVEARFGWNATEVTQDVAGVRIAIADTQTGATETIAADYAVGCDGGRSLVRDRIGIGRHSNDFDQPMVLAVFRSADLHEGLKRFPERSTYRVLHPDLEGYWLFFGRVDPGGEAATGPSGEGASGSAAGHSFAALPGLDPGTHAADDGAPDAATPGAGPSPPTPGPDNSRVEARIRSGQGDGAGTPAAIDLDAAEAEAAGPGWFFHAPLPPGTDRDDFDVDAMIERAAGFAFDAYYEHVGFWDLRISIAERYRAGRVFIAGDAAHAHPPYGAFGLNTGLEDAVNLGWKLAAVLQGWGGAALLDSYEAERRPVFQETAEHFIMAQVESERAFLAAYDPARDRAAFEAEWARFADVVPWSKGYEPHYEGSAVVAGGAGRSSGARGTLSRAARPGHHLAPCPLDDGRDVFEALGPGFTLLALGDGLDAAVAAFGRAAGAAGVPLATVRAGRDGGREAYEAALVMVRPDQFVAWIGEAAPADATAVLARAVGR